jgi:hypothetical protein
MTQYIIGEAQKINLLFRQPHFFSLNGIVVLFSPTPDHYRGVRDCG